MSAKKRAKNIRSVKQKLKEVSLDEFETEFPTTSREVQQKGVGFRLDIKVPHQLTDKQKDILKRMTDYKTKMVLIDGVWGSSKSYISVLSAITLLSTGNGNKIYYVRSPVESSDTAKIGTLPGDLNEKMVGFAGVVEEKLAEFLPYNQVNRLLKEEYVEFLPPGFMRGRSLENAILICDEASNFSWKDLLLISSRLGNNSKMFVIGDSYQNDIGNKSGFERFFDLFHNDDESKQNGVHTFTMKDKDDVLRSGFVKFVMEKAGVLTFSR